MITALARYFVGDPNIVSIVTDDDLTALTTTGYWNLQETVDSVEAIQNGEFQWTDTDLVVIHYDGNQIGFFTYDAVNFCFDALDPAGGLSDTLQSGNVFVGNSSNIATGVAMTGVIAITNTGVTSIVDGSIVNADINASAAIAYSKLAALTSGNILVGSAGNVATSVSMSGDVAISNTGVTTIQPGSIDLAMLSSGITPAAVIKFANQVTTVGGAAAEAFTVTGAVAATDRAFVQVVDNGTANVTVLQAVVTTNTLTVTFSGNPGNDTIINYQIIRAAA